MPESTKSYTRAPCFASGDGIICAGLPRSGTLSLSTALTTLGIVPVHHVLTQTSMRDFYAWGQAAWCNMPGLRAHYLGQKQTGRGPAMFAPHDPMLPWRRADWDRLIGDYRATSDIASMFTEDLIRNYPEAKVILVERDVDRWMASFGGLFVDGWFFGWNWFVMGFLSHHAGYPGLRIVSDMMMIGWLGATSKKGAWEKMPVKHREHSEMVRRLVPQEQLLVFRLEDGWEPLCKFLDVPVPQGVPFPHVNDNASLRAFRRMRIRTVLKFWGARVALLAAVGVGAWALRRDGWGKRLWNSCMQLFGRC